MFLKELSTFLQFFKYSRQLFQENFTSMSLMLNEEVPFFVQVMIGKHAFNGASYNAVYLLSVLAVHIIFMVGGAVHK